nr:probable UDP-3-O-acyl-N-acetylglucosamine deacetylase 2 [Tanacetum cinerariifolium]
MKEKGYELAGKGRYFDFGASFIPASIEYVKDVSPLCTTLSKDGRSVRTVKHLLLALEGAGVDNCSVEIVSSHQNDTKAEVPIFDGSAREWVKAIMQVGLTAAMDSIGRGCDKLAPYLTQPVHVSKGDSLIAAFPSKETNISYGINFPQAINIRWVEPEIMFTVLLKPYDIMQLRIGDLDAHIKFTVPNVFWIEMMITWLNQARDKNIKNLSLLLNGYKAKAIRLMNFIQSRVTLSLAEE